MSSSKPAVSIVLPTRDRPALLRRAIESVLKQTYSDWELIVIDDSENESAAEAVKSFSDTRIRYIHNTGAHGGGAARNVGIRASACDWIAFLDDDDEWLPEKLAKQFSAVASAGPDIGFCVTAVINVFDQGERNTVVEEGVTDFSEIALRRFKGFLTSTLLIRRSVFETSGLFDESLPTHQEAELIIRITRTYKGVGISIPLVRMNMRSGHDHIGGDINRRIRGREIVLEKHRAIYAERPALLAQHLFWLGLWYRDAQRTGEARDSFGRAWGLVHRPLYLIYWAIASVRVYI